jgi:hypothetical protein
MGAINFKSYGSLMSKVPKSAYFLSALMVCFIFMNFLNPYNCHFRGGRDRRRLAPTIGWQPNDVKLSIVLPFPELNKAILSETIHRMVAVGSPCSKNAASAVQLIVYGNVSALVDKEKPVIWVMEGLGMYYSCFSKVVVLGTAELSPEDPGGPNAVVNKMFFDLFLNDAVRNRFPSSTHAFWMEPDATPVRPHWIDALVGLAARSNFWMAGSVYRGSGLDEAAESPGNRNWVGRIGGSAVYNMRDEAFSEFLRVVTHYEPAVTRTCKFDVSIWRVLHTFPYTWPLYQAARSRFIHANFLHDWASRISPSDVARTRSGSTAYFVHGSSATDADLPQPTPPTVPPDAVPPTLRLSVFVRALGGDAGFVREAVLSVAKHAPHVFEIVVLFPAGEPPSSADSFLAIATASPPVRVAVGPSPVEDALRRRVWWGLHADSFCRGDLILHLDSGTVLWRLLQLRDFLWLGRPLLSYRRPDELPALAGLAATEDGAEFEFGTVTGALQVFPRSLYPRARAHAAARHGGNVTRFVRDTAGASEAAGDGTALLAAYAWRHASDDFSLAPGDGDEQRRVGSLVPTPVVPSPACRFPAAKAVSDGQGAVDATLAALRDIREAGLACDRLPHRIQ